jgi:hypothetical protein
MKTQTTKSALASAIAARPIGRSAWSKAVTAYCDDLLESIESEEIEPDTLKSVLLNGAQTWSEYSYGGCSLIYDADIAERVCCPSELKKTRGGERQPNSRETWLDCQARALFQAASRILRTARQIATL